MPWFKVDDNLTFHAKVVAAGNPAMGLWVRAGSWCALQLTDGFIPNHMLVALGTPAQAQRLVTVGLWDRAEGGFTFHAWGERQPTKADVEAERSAARERMREARAKRKGAKQEPSPQVSEPRSPEPTENFGGTSPEVQPACALPDPVPVPVPVPVPTKKGRREATRPIPEDWEPTDNHRALASEHGLDLAGEAFRFRNNAISKDLRFARWNAAFNTWLSKSASWNTPSRSSASSSTGTGEAAIWRQAGLTP